MLSSIITLLGSSFFSSVFQLITQSKENSCKVKLAEIAAGSELAAQQVAEMMNARQTDNDSWVKRILAIIVVFVVFVAPTFIGLVHPSLNVAFLYYDFSGSLSLPLKQTITHGFTIFPYQVTASEVVLGFYFGRSIVRRGK